eukprot:981125-Rhodomonas_salina.3
MSLVASRYCLTCNRDQSTAYVYMHLVASRYRLGCACVFHMPPDAECGTVHQAREVGAGRDGADRG